jgi:hypothetical protein
MGRPIRALYSEVTLYQPEPVMNDHSNALLAAAELLKQSSHLDLLDLDEEQIIQLLAVLDCKLADVETRLAELRTRDLLAMTRSKLGQACNGSEPASRA